LSIEQQKPVLKTAMQACLQVLSREPDGLRPHKTDQTPGGVVRLDQDLDVILVPDLHGRADQIEALLAWPVGGVAVGELLDQGNIQLIFCGDYVHAEARARERWKRALTEYESNFEHHQAMDEEMEENIASWIHLAKLKAEYPYHVHLLKGNHENILDSAKDPNRNFGKFAYESAMATTWCRKFLGDDLIDLIHRFEEALPLMVIGKDWVVSHAQPDKAYPLTDLIQAGPEVGFGLTWTRQNNAQSGAAKEMMNSLLGKPGIWFAGHCSLAARYLWNPEESILHFHNPAEFSVIHWPGEGVFDPQKHVVTLRGGENL